MEEAGPSQVNESDICFICNEFNPCEVTCKVTRGLRTLINASVERNDGLLPSLKAEFVFVHETCRQKYIHKQYIKSAKKQHDTKVELSPPKKKLRKSVDAFNWINNCFICGNVAVDTKLKKSKRPIISNVITNNLKDSVFELIKDRRDDYREIFKRVTGVPDLVSKNAVYHKNCLLQLRNYVPEGRELKTHKQVALVDEAMDSIFQFMEQNDDCQFTLEELKSNVTGHVPDNKTIVSRLKRKYGNNIVISCQSSYSTIICFRDKEHDVLSKQWYEDRSLNEDEEKLRILKAAADIIRSDIRSVPCEVNFYSSSDTFFHDVDAAIPQTLSYFLQEVIMKDKKKKRVNESAYKIKCSAICHSIMSAVRPRSFLSSLQVGLAVTLHRKFGSRRIIDICSSLGFCASYNEAKLYETSALFKKPTSVKPNTFVQFVHDNADFNVNTLDGKNTFHNMGSIGIYTPASGIQDEEPIERLKIIPSEADIAKKGNIPLLTYNYAPGEGLQKVLVKISEDALTLQPSLIAQINTLWMFLKWKNNKFIGWNGFMQSLTDLEDFQISKVLFYPFINASPSDYNTIYTAVVTSAEKAVSLCMKTCFITFDQPLYMKARDILAATLISDETFTVIRLGGFHMLMSFMGCIGYIMGGSGINQVLHLIYAEKTVDHILYGHAYARAVRAHTLLQLALSRIIFKHLECEQDFTELLGSNSDFFSKFNKLQTETLHLPDISENKEFKQLAEIFEKRLEEIENKGKTAKLWISYFKMVSIVKDFIAAERMGDWALHLRCVELMIPYFHSAGHFPYAKSSQIYLQDMQELEKKMDPEEYNKFTQEMYFTARRTNISFAGIHTNQTIEQTLMKSMSVEGGPFRRGVTDSVVYQWINGVACTNDIIDGIETFCNISFKKSHQHADSTDARITRDGADVNKLEEWFQSHDPFPELDAIMNIATGVIGHEKINCYNAFDEGIEAVKRINGQNFRDLKLKTSQKVVPLLAASSKLKINNEHVPIDPLLLFQRITVLKKSNTDLQNYLKYELAPYPLSLYDEAGMRKTQKSTLYSVFEECPRNVSDTNNFAYIIDGGMFLHRVKWQLNQTFHSILDSYVRYVFRNYGNNVTIVFDGYERDTIKAAERNRRCLQNASPDYAFEEDMQLKVAQEKFLSNVNNKSRFINKLKPYLTENSISWKQADGDADRLIVTTAVDSPSSNVVVVAEDIDILVLLTALTPDGKEIYFLKPPKGKVPQKVYSSASLDGVPSCKSNILFLHAFTGCDTTSAFFNKGKSKFFTMFTSRKCLQEAAEIFKKDSQSVETIREAGVLCILNLYGAQQCESDLNQYRYKCFKGAVSKESRVQLSNLPCTTDAATEHLKKVYLQVQLWLGNYLPPTEWGWKSGTFLMPIPMNQEPAPQDLLKIIFCKCKSGCAGNCGCRKTGLFCTEACFHCNGQNCTNCAPITLEENELENEENV